MSKIIYPNRKEISGPLLITDEKITELDVIISDVWEKLLEYREKQLETLVEEELEDREVADENREKEKERIREIYRDQYNFSAEQKEITVHLKNGNKVVGDDFKSIEKDRVFENELAIGFSVRIRCGDVRIYLDVADSEYTSLNFEVEPQDISLSNEIFHHFDRWIISIQPHLWQRIWRRGRGYHWLILFLIFFFALISNLITSNYNSLLDERAKTLLKDGISNDELLESVEIILAREFNYIPEKYKSIRDTHSTYVKFNIIITLFLLMLGFIWQFPPKVYLGIGKGMSTIKRWKVYVRIISISIPSLLLSSVIIPWLMTLL